MATLAPPALVSGAVRAPLPHGLLSVVQMRTGDRWESGVTWESVACTKLRGLGAPATTAGTAEVQRITITGSPTGGTFTLTYGGLTTAPIAYNATAAAVATALRAITVESFTAGGGALPGAFVTITWDTPGVHAQMTSAGSFTGGTTPAVAVTTTTDGVNPTYTVIGSPKTFDVGNLIGTAVPFTVYGQFKCSPLAWSPSEAQARAQEQLLTREEARVEQAFWTADLGSSPTLRSATALAGGAAVGPSVGLAALEDSLASSYGSLGVLHMTRGTAIQMVSRQLLEVRSGRLVSRLGTPVIAGAGYDGSSPAGAAAAAGKSWAYITPAIFGYRSEVFTSSDEEGDLLARATNDMYAIAERSYLLGFDACGYAAAQIDLALT